MRRLTGESREAIAKSLRAHSYSDIVGIAPKPNGWKRDRVSKLTDEAKAEIVTLMKFLRHSEIAELYGVTADMINHFLRRIRPLNGWDKRPPHKNGKLSDEEKKDIVARWLKGESMEKIARRHEVSCPTISYVIKRQVPAEDKHKRIPQKWGTLSEKQIQNAVKRRENGATLATIAKSYRTSEVVIHNATKNAAPPGGWPKGHSKLSEEQKQRVIEQRKNGDHPVDIGKSCNVTAVLIRKITKDAAPPGGWPKRRGSLSDEQKQQAIERRRNGESLREIGKLYNTSRNTILIATKAAKPPEGWPNPRHRKKKPDLS